MTVRYGFVMFETGSRRPSWSALAATVVSSAAVVLAPGAYAEPHGAEQPGPPVIEGAPVLDMHASADLPEAADLPAPADLPVVVPAAHVDHPVLLPPGDVAEGGLQVKTILAARAVSAEFPEITNMIGVRPDSRRWHPNGLAVDIMIPNPGSAEGVALGDAILAFALRNADRFGLQDVIWRGVYYTPAGPSGSGYGHFDHVHITTTGGGYPTGAEEYLGG